MIQEIYKMYYKKYLFALFLLLLLPILFGLGSYFHLPYMTSGAVSASAFDYCAEMQALEKYFYFLISVYLASDYFVGELEDGQLSLELMYIHSRKKALFKKVLSYAALMFLFQLVLWGFNFTVYTVCDARVKGLTVMQGNRWCDYLGMFFGYWEMFMICGGTVMIAGLFLKKVHTLTITYFLWFSLRYVNELTDLKNILPEFSADFLMGNVSGSRHHATGCLVGGAIVIVMLMAAFVLFERKDIH